MSMCAYLYTGRTSSVREDMCSVHERLAMLDMEIHVQQLQKWGKSRSSTLLMPQHGADPSWERGQKR